MKCWESVTPSYSLYYYYPTLVTGCRLWRGGTPIGIAVEEFFRVQGVESFHTAMKTVRPILATPLLCNGGKF